jgi:hypothetical protein
MACDHRSREMINETKGIPPKGPRDCDKRGHVMVCGRLFCFEHFNSEYICKKSPHGFHVSSDIFSGYGACGRRKCIQCKYCDFTSED